MNKFLKIMSVVLIFALFFGGGYIFYKEVYRKGQESVRAEFNQSQSEMEVKFNQIQLDLAEKIAENNELKIEVNQLTAEKQELVESGQASQEQISVLDAQITALNSTITNNESVITALNSKLSKIISIVDKTVTEITADDLEGFTKIFDGMFYFCTSLESVTIPASVTSIGVDAFVGCDNINTLTVLATTPPTLTDATCCDCAGVIYIPAGTLEAYSTANNWQHYSNKFVELEG